jgi:acylphosphatase
MDVHATIVASGLVQGVGFRWFVNRHAVRLGLKGFVRNNFDGTVLVEVEGDRSLVEELIKELKVGPRAAHVSDLKIEWSDAKNMFLGFSIK